MAIRHVLLVLALALLPSPADAGPEAAAEDSNASRPLTAIMELRLRAEDVRQAGFPDDAEAVTLRGRFGFETPQLRHTTLLAEGELVWPLRSHYDSTLNGNSGLPIVLDPESYEVNRLQLTNTALPDTRLVVGRQRITYDDHRFIGNVGWRQNEQTYDALRVVNRSLRELTVDAAYVNQVNRVQGSDSPVGRYHGDSFLTQVAYAMPSATLTGFGNLLDVDEAPADSTRTLGVRLAVHGQVRTFALSGSAGHATQEDHAGNPLDFRLGWYSLDLFATYGRVSLGMGREVLAGNGIKGFSTPLATLHAFQGWADKFVQTPANGIDDRWAQLGYIARRIARLERVSAVVVYHDFRAQRLGDPYGSELDLQVRAEGKRTRAAIKLADYDSDGFADDTRKLWAEIELVW